MAEKVQAKVEEFTQEQIDWAYGVIDGICEAMGKVENNPMLAPKFMGELLSNMPKFVDAFMVLTVPQHRLMMAKLIQSSSRCGAEWLKVVQTSLKKL